ncbi:MAG: hypothetical protein EBQ67_06860 [Sphingobacteriia bacterium]|nr:hypothetical protein [Sphingobacteriia bacterium]
MEDLTVRLGIKLCYRGEFRCRFANCRVDRPRPWNSRLCQCGESGRRGQGSNPS